MTTRPPRPSKKRSERYSVPVASLAATLEEPRSISKDALPIQSCSSLIQSCSDPKDSLNDLIQMVRDECSSAALRHQDILARLLEQHQDVKKHLCQLSMASPHVHNFDRVDSGTCDKVSSDSQKLQSFEGSTSSKVSFSPVTEVHQALPAPSPVGKPFLDVHTCQTLAESAETCEAPVYPSGETLHSATSFCSNRNSTIEDGPRRTLRESRLHLTSKRSGSLDYNSGFRELAVSLVEHAKFEVVIAGLIFANALVMCFEVQYKGLHVDYSLQYSEKRSTASATWPEADTVFDVFEWMFGLLFLSECALKIYCYKCRYFRDAWNWLDFIVVLAFLVDKAAAIMRTFDLDNSIIQLLRLFRLVRLVRLLKTMEGMDTLYIMTTAIKGMSEILMYAVALLSVMLMTNALFLTQILHATYFSNVSAGNLSGAELERKQQMYEYFGSFTRSLLSMFELTLANWPPVTRLLAEEVSEWFMILCLIHKLTIGFAVIGVINGVILQETFRVAQTDDVIMLRQKKRSTDILRMKMTNLFEALDDSGDGLLDYDEFDTIAQDPDVKTWLASMDIETDDLPTLFTLIDSEQTGTVSVDRLVTRIARIKGAARSIDVLILAKKLQDCDTMIRTQSAGK